MDHFLRRKYNLQRLPVVVPVLRRMPLAGRPGTQFVPMKGDPNEIDIGIKPAGVRQVCRFVSGVLK